MKLLDFFCGAGGAAMGYHRAGFEVVGVDIRPQPNYPFEFHQADALEFPLDGFDLIHASPPCQAYCALNTMPNLRKHKKLIPAVRDLLESSGTYWIIENVEGARRELRDPIMLCGSMFGLGSNGYQVRRHRYFESNFPINVPMPCDHGARTMGIYGAKVRDIAKEKRHYAKPKKTRGKPIGVVLPQKWGLEAMGVEWMNIKEASQSIPPAYTEYIGRQLMAQYNNPVQPTQKAVRLT